MWTRASEGAAYQSPAARDTGESLILPQCPQSLGSRSKGHWRVPYTPLSVPIHKSPCLCSCAYCLHLPSGKSSFPPGFWRGLLLELHSDAVFASVHYVHIFGASPKKKKKIRPFTCASIRKAVRGRGQHPCHTVCP